MGVLLLRLLHRFPLCGCCIAVVVAPMGIQCGCGRISAIKTPQVYSVGCGGLLLWYIVDVIV